MHSFRFVEQAAEHWGALILIPSTQTTHTYVHAYIQNRTEQNIGIDVAVDVVVLVWGIFCFVVFCAVCVSLIVGVVGCVATCVGL